MSKISTNGYGVTSVAYVGGMGRSGSTILQAVLGGVDGFVPLGRSPRGLASAPDQRTLRVRRALLQLSFLEAGRASRIWRMERRTLRGHDQSRSSSSAPPADTVLHCQRPHWRHARSRGKLADALGHVYAAAARVSKSRVLIDSTKDAPYAYLLDGMPTVDLRVVHLVRDPRAVAHSWRRLVERPEYREIDSLRDSHMDRYRCRLRPPNGRCETSYSNHCASEVSRRPGSCTRISCGSQRNYRRATRISRHIPAATRYATWTVSSVMLPFTPLVGTGLGSGRGECQSGKTRLGERDARRDRLICTVLSLPVLIAYGYRVRGTGDSVRVLVVSLSTYSAPYNDEKLECLAAHCEDLQVVTGAVETLWGRFPGPRVGSGYRVVALPVRVGSRPSFSLLVGLDRVAHAFRPTHVHIETEPWQGIAFQGLRVARRFGARVGVQFAENGPRLSGVSGLLRTTFGGAVLRRCDYADGWSSASAAVARTMAPDIRVEVMPGTGVPRASFHATPAVEDLRGGSAPKASSADASRFSVGWKPRRGFGTSWTSAIVSLRRTQFGSR